MSWIIKNPTLTAPTFRPAAFAAVAFVFLVALAGRVHAQSAPYFNWHPSNQQVVAGAASYYSVGVLGTPAPSLRWQRLPAGTNVWLDLNNDSVFSGVTSTYFQAIASSQSMSGDQFRCVATNALGTAISNAAVLTVTPATPPSIATNPNNVTAKESEGVSYICYGASSTSGPLTIRWQRLPAGGNTWSDLTAGGSYTINSSGPSAYFYVNPVSLAMNGDKFRCVFTNIAGSATSAEALLTVNPADSVVISGLPATIFLPYGATLSISSVMIGTYPYTVKWYKDGVLIPNAGSNSYYKQFSTQADSGVYTVTATNAAGTTTSSPVTVTVADPILPAITSQPASGEFAKDSSAGIWVTATGSPTLAFQWYKNGVAISGATGTSIYYGSVTFADAGDYFVKVTNDAGTVTSATAVLTVLPVPLPSFPTWGWLATTTLQPYDNPAYINIGSSIISPGSPNATYQWYKDGTAIPGSTQGIFYKYLATASDAGLYSVAVTNESGMAMSPEMIIKPAPTSTISPWISALRLDDIVYFLVKDPGRILRYDLAGETWLPTVNLTPGKVPTAVLPTAEGIFVSYGTELVRRSLDLQTETPVVTSSASIHCLFSVGPCIYYSDNYPTIRSRNRATLAAGPNSAPAGNASVLGQATPPVYVASANKLVSFELNSVPHRLVSFSVAPDGVITGGSATSNNLFNIGSRWFLSADETKIFDTGGMAFSTSDFSYQGSFGLPLDDLALLPGGGVVVLRGNSLVKHSGAGLASSGRCQLNSAGRNLFVRGTSMYVFSAPAEDGGTPGVAKVDTSALVTTPLPVPGSPVGRKFSVENCFIDASGVVNLVSRTEKAVIRWSTVTRDFVASLPLHGPPVRSSYDSSLDRLVAYYRDGTLTDVLPGSQSTEHAFANVPYDSPAWALVTMGDHTLATIMPHPANGIKNVVMDSSGLVTQSSLDSFENPWWFWNPAARRVYLHNEYVSPESGDFRFMDVPQSNVVPSYNSGTVVNNVPLGLMRAGTDAGLLLLEQEIRTAGLAKLATLENPVTDGEWLGDSLFTIRLRPAGTEIQQWAVANYAKTGSLLVSGMPLRILRVNDDTLVVVTLVNGYATFYIVPANLTSPVSYYSGPTAGTPPTILVPPHDIVATAGQAATLAVSATGSNPLTYQWQKNGVNISGATSASYTIASTTLNDAGSYSVMATNSVGTATSNAAVLKVTTVKGNALAHGATNFPSGAAAGTVINFSYTVTNTGTKALGMNHYLGLLRGDGSLVQLASVASTAVGGSRTVIFSLPTPASAGTYQYWVQPLENGVEWFGNPVILTLAVSAPAVSAQGNAVAYGAHSFSLSAAAGSVVNFTYTVTNAGTKAWGANHSLALMQSDYTVIQLGSLNGTAVGGSKTVTFSLPTPATAGTYQYLVQPLENGVEWFGSPVTLTLTVTAPVVSAQGNAVAYVTNNFPLSASAGSVVNFTCNVSNLGTKAWGGNHYLALMQSDYSVIQLGSLDGTVVGGSRTVSLSLPVPATPGTYQYLVQPLENGVEWFGCPVTLTLTVTPAVVTAQGNALAYGLNTFPLSASAGSVVNFNYNVSNLGTKAWGPEHYLALLDAGFNLIEFADLNGIVAGGSTTANFSFPVPGTPGTYQYIVRPLENGLEWFGTQLSLSLIVTPAVVTAQGNALGYGTTTFPVTVNAGATVNFTYNVTNLGTKPWGSNHYLALLEPGYTLVDFGDLNATAAGGSKAASVSFTAPSTPGTYHYILRPLENGLEWFGTEVHLTLTVL